MSSATNADGANASAYIARTGELASLLRQKDWSRTPIGPLATWPQCLRTAMDICLGLPHPAFIWWGSDRILLYNDAACAILGAMHPGALGLAGKDVWTAISPALASLVEAIFDHGDSTGTDAYQLAVKPDTRTEEPRFSFANSPIYGDNGVVAGVFTTATEAKSPATDERPRRRSAPHVRETPFEAFFEAIADAAFVYDRTGNIVRMNAAARTLFALDSNSDYESLSPVERAHLIAVRDEQGHPISAENSGLYRLLQGEVLTGANAEDVRLRLADGRELEVSITGAPLVDARGEITGAIAISRDVTERRRLERQIRWQASMLERAHDAIFMWELGGTISYWNRGAELLYGFSRVEAIGQVTHDLLHTRLPRPRAQFEEMLTRDGEWAGELTHTTRDGHQVVVISRQQLVTEDDGHVYVLETSRDITERKSLERTIVKRARQLEAIFEAAADGLAIYDEHGNLREWNRELAAMFEFDRMPEYPTLSAGERTPRLSVRSVDDQLISLEDMPFMQAARGATLTGASAIDMTVTLPSGRVANVSASAAPLRSATGRANGSVVVYRDVTERLALQQRVRAALDALLEMAEALVENEDIREVKGGLHAPASGTATIARRLAELARGILGCSRVNINAVDGEQLLIRPVAVVGLTPEQERHWWAEREAKPPQRVGEGLAPADRERLFAGEMFTLDLTRPPYEIPNDYGVTSMLVAPMRMQGHIVGLLLLDFQDVGRPVHIFTESELRIAEAVARLGAVVLERDRLLRERELARAETLALEKINRRMSDFLGIASHELRTPLTSIRANIQIIERRLGRITTSATDTLEQLSSAEHIREQLVPVSTLAARSERQMRRLDRLISDLLDVTRIEAGKLEYEPVPCNLTSIAYEAVEEQRAVWPGRPITFESEPAEIPVSGDPDRLGQVVTNYLTNALKYSRSDQPVAVGIRVEGDAARVEVRDMGPGLTPEQQVGLFERFYRVPGIDQRSGSGIGLGLGLSICRTIVERHGGQVGVKSIPDEGSAFWFTLPRATLASTETSLTPAADETDGAQRSRQNAAKRSERDRKSAGGG